MGRRRSTAASLIEYSLELEGGGARFEWADLSAAEEAKLAAAAHRIDHRRSGVDYYGAHAGRGAWHVFTYDEPPAAWVKRYNRGEIPPRKGSKMAKRTYRSDAQFREHIADEVLALFGGDEAKTKQALIRHESIWYESDSQRTTARAVAEKIFRAMGGSPRTGGTQRRGWARDSGERKLNAFDRMTDAAARWMYVGAWASEWDNAYSEGCIDDLPYPPGAELYAYAPETPDEMIEQARKVLKEVEQMNGIDLVDWAADHNVKPELVGEGIVQEAQGEGVGLWEHVDDHGLKIPRLEVQLEVPELAELGCYD